MSDLAHDAYRPIIEDGRGIFPEDFRVKAPLGFNAAVRAAAQRQHMTRLNTRGALCSEALKLMALGFVEATSRLSVVSYDAHPVLPSLGKLK